MRKINKLGRRVAALVLAVGLTLSTAAPVLAADADEVQTPAAQTEQQETDTEADEADVDTETEADEAAALPELSEDREAAGADGGRCPAGTVRGPGSGRGGRGLGCRRGCLVERT